MSEAQKLLLYCPKCGRKHVDRGEWATRVHKTHLCEYCKYEWRPFKFPTFGIEKVPTTPAEKNKRVAIG